MKFFRNFLIIVAILWSLLWVAGYFLINQNIDEVLSEVEPSLEYNGRSIGGYPFGYTLTLREVEAQIDRGSNFTAEKIIADWRVWRFNGVRVRAPGNTRVNASQGPVLVQLDPSASIFASLWLKDGEPYPTALKFNMGDARIDNQGDQVQFKDLNFSLRQQGSDDIALNLAWGEIQIPLIDNELGRLGQTLQASTLNATFPNGMRLMEERVHPRTLLPLIQREEIGLNISTLSINWGALKLVGEADLLGATDGINGRVAFNFHDIQALVDTMADVISRQMGRGEGRNQLNALIGMSNALQAEGKMIPIDIRNNEIKLLGQTLANIEDAFPASRRTN